MCVQRVFSKVNSVFLINYRGVFGMCEIYVENFRVYSRLLLSPVLSFDTKSRRCGVMEFGVLI